MKFYISTRLRGLFFANQLALDIGEVGRRDKEAFLVIQAELGGQRGYCAVSGGNVENARTVGQLPELILPELENDAVIISGLARAKGRNKSLLPEGRPSVDFVCADGTSPNLSVIGIIVE